jgi:hypothetical protein
MGKKTRSGCRDTVQQVILQHWCELSRNPKKKKKKTEEMCAQKKRNAAGCRVLVWNDHNRPKTRASCGRGFTRRERTPLKKKKRVSSSPSSSHAGGGRAEGCRRAVEHGAAPGVFFFFWDARYSLAPTRAATQPFAAGKLASGGELERYTPKKKKKKPCHNRRTSRLPRGGSQEEKGPEKESSSLSSSQGSLSLHSLGQASFCLLWV